MITTMPDEPAQALCGEADRIEPMESVSRPNRELREILFDCAVNFSLSAELSTWLRELDLPCSGTLWHQLARLRQEAASLVLPAESFPRQAIYYLSHYDRVILCEICEQLGISNEGSAETLFKRIYGTVGLREGWLHPVPEDARGMTRNSLFPMLRNFGLVKDYSEDDDGPFSDSQSLHEEVVSVPLAYGRALICVVVPDLLQEGQAVLIRNALKSRGLDLE